MKWLLIAALLTVSQGSVPAPQKADTRENKPEVVRVIHVDVNKDPADYLYIGATLLIALLTLVIAGIAWLQANAAKDAAGAAKASADALIASERAWTMVDLERQPGAGFIMDGTSGDGTLHTSAFVRCICNNQGKTPARISEKRICLKVINAMQSLPQEPDFNIEIIDSEPHYLQSGQPSTHDWTISGKRSGSITDKVFIYGEIKYRHIFSGHEVHTTFGYKVTQDRRLERLSGYPKYNENT